MTTNVIHVITWNTQTEPKREGILGVFNDEIKANEIYDALDQYGSPDKDYYIDKYELNEIKRGDKIGKR